MESNQSFQVGMRTEVSVALKQLRGRNRLYDDSEMMTKEDKQFVTPRIAYPRIPQDILFAIGGFRGGKPSDVIEAYDARAERWSVSTAWQFVPYISGKVSGFLKRIRAESACGIVARMKGDIVTLVPDTTTDSGPLSGCCDPSVRARVPRRPLQSLREGRTATPRACQRPRRRQLSQENLGPGWNHVVRGGRVVKAKAAKNPASTPSGAIARTERQAVPKDGNAKPARPVVPVGYPAAPAPKKTVPAPPKGQSPLQGISDLLENLPTQACDETGEPWFSLCTPAGSDVTDTPISSSFINQESVFLLAKKVQKGSTVSKNFETRNLVFPTSSIFWKFRLCVTPGIKLRGEDLRYE
ncbi:Kelch-like protein 10 [Zootermopsis nevadensis]|uniref:Kelch-like protein 10 n=1 Tax=Zootermopsis nevadensis TaxID=136037 RepID=A0A067RK25_ZOONE|nr:Kelch-like protein 10 [Zootermopsis nevadensis]